MKDESALAGLGSGAYINHYFLTKRQKVMVYFCFHKFQLGRQSEQTFVIPAQTSPAVTKCMVSVDVRGVWPCLPPKAVWMIYSQARGGRLSVLSPQEAFAIMGMRLSDFFPGEQLLTLDSWLHYTTLIRLAGNSFAQSCAGRFAVASLALSRTQNLGRLYTARSGKAVPDTAPWHDDADVAE